MFIYNKTIDANSQKLTIKKQFVQLKHTSPHKCKA